MIASEGQDKVKSCHQFKSFKQWQVDVGGKRIVKCNPHKSKRHLIRPCKTGVQAFEARQVKPQKVASQCQSPVRVDTLGSVLDLMA